MRDFIPKLVYELRLLRVCPREHQAVVLHGISPILMNLCQFKGSTPRLKQTNWFLFWLFPWEDRLPPVFLGYHWGNRFKIGKMYEDLTAMVFTDYSEGLLPYDYILSRCNLMSDASISQFDWRLVNQQRQINDFWTSRFIQMTSSRLNISPGQKAN